MAVYTTCPPDGSTDAAPVPSTVQDTLQAELIVL